MSALGGSNVGETTGLEGGRLAGGCGCMASNVSGVAGGGSCGLWGLVAGGGVAGVAG